MEIINSESPAPQRLAGYLFKALDQREKYKPLVLTSWVKVFESLLQETGLDFDSLLAIVRFAVKENEWTVTNLRVARDPAVSLRKQWDNICLHYDAHLAAKRARERKSWKYGACPVCDEAESNYGNACDACATKAHLELLETLWSRLNSNGLVKLGKLSSGRPAWYIGRDPEHAVCAAPDSKEELKAHVLRSTDAWLINNVDELLPEDERLYLHRETFEKEGDQ